MNVKKRTLALILALVMLTTAAPLAVFAEKAAPELTVDADGYYLIDNYKDLDDHLLANKNNLVKTLKYRLNGDVTATSDGPLAVIGTRAVIDLNGHELCDTFYSHSSMFLIRDKGYLTVRDTSEEKTGSILFQSSYSKREDLDDEDTGLVHMFWVSANSTLEIESGSFEQTSKGAIVGANGGTVKIYDGNFDAGHSGANGGFFIVDVQRTSADVPASMIFIYDGTFQTLSDTIWFDSVYYDDTYPLVAVLGGEFYTDSELGFNYYKGTGDTFVAGGLIPISKYEHEISNRKSYADGAKKTDETIGEKKYIRVEAPQWLVTDTLTADRRFEDATVRYVLSSYEQDSDYYKNNSEFIKSYLRYPVTAYIGERDLDPVNLRVNGQRSGVKRMRLFSSSTVATNWGDTTWNLVEAIDSPEGEVTFTVDRPMKKTTRYYRLKIEYEDGTEWSDYIGLDFAEAAPVMSGTAFPTQNAVRYGNTLICGLKDLPSAIPVGSLRFEWRVDGEVVGTERTIKLSDPSWIGKELTVKVTSTVAVGSIVSDPATIGKNVQRGTALMPTVTAQMSGGNLAQIDVSGVMPSQEYLLSAKQANELTEDDWANAVRPTGASLSYDPGQIASAFGFEPASGDTVYVHTRFAETEVYLPGANVTTASVYIGETVTLRSIVFPESQNGTMYLSYSGYEEAYDIPYALVPANANAGGDIRWRVSGPVELEYPTASESVQNAGGYITVITKGVGTAHISAYYMTATENAYGSLEIVLYDPDNVGTELLMPVEPLEDVYVYAGNGYSTAIPEFVIAPTVEPEYKWYFTRGTLYGYEKITETEFASIDPATGEIETSAPGRVTVSLFANETLVDSYELTVLEKPDSYVALEALYADASELTLGVGDKHAIGVLKAPANASAEKFTFTSSDLGVAVVDSDGVVYAHAAGNAVITVSAPAEGVSVEVKLTVVSSLPSVKPGDVNGDGKINSRDVIMLMKAIIAINAGSDLPKGFNSAAADLHTDGKINSRDVIDLMKAVIAASQGK